MNVSIIYVFEVYTEFTHAGSEVAFREKKDVLVLCQTDPHSNVKFAFMDK